MGYFLSIQYQLLKMYGFAMGRALDFEVAPQNQDYWLNSTNNFEQVVKG